MSSLAPSASQPEWKNRKRRGEFLQKEAVRRCPKYVNTEVKDPGYIKIQSLVDNYCNAINYTNRTERTGEFITQMENYLGMVTSDKPTGVLLLRRMAHKRKLAMLVWEKFWKALGVALCSFSWPIPHVEAWNRLEDCFMVNCNNLLDPSWKRAFKAMNSLCKSVDLRNEQHKLQRRLEIAAKGGSVVEWSDDDV